MQSLRTVVHIAVLKTDISQCLGSKSFTTIKKLCFTSIIGIIDPEETAFSEEQTTLLWRSMETNLALIGLPVIFKSEAHHCKKRLPYAHYAFNAPSPSSAPHIKNITSIHHNPSKIMRKTTLIAVLLCLSAISISWAQQDTTVYLNELQVTGNRISTQFSETSRNVSLMDKAEIRTAPAQSLPEMLSYVPGVDIRQRGPLGVQSDISIRGGSFEQTLIMLNGIKMSDPQSGHHMLNVPINNAILKRIEVVKGPGARIYGQNAFAGAVNFITEPPAERKVFLDAYYGSFTSYGMRTGVSLPAGKIRQFASFGIDKSDGYRYNTDYDMKNAFYQASVPVGAGSLEALVGYTKRKFGANGFYSSPQYADQYEEIESLVSSISYNMKTRNWKITPRISWRNNEDYYLFVRNNPETYLNRHTTNTYAAEINSYNENAWGRTGLGIEFREETIDGDWVRTGEKTKSNLDGFSRNNIGLFAEHQFTFMNKKLDVTPGLYASHYSDYDFQVFPGIDAGYQLNAALRIYGNIGRSYRIPTFYDQYYDSPTEQGNKNLQPEEAWTYELGGRMLVNKLILEANVFYRDNDKLIDWVLDPSDSVWKAQNFSEIATKGLELSAIWQFPAYSYLNRIQLSYNFLNQNLQDSELTSRYTLEHLQHQLIFNINHTIIGNLKNDFRARYIKRIDQDDYWLVDDRLFYDAHIIQIFAQATNITNTSYSEVMTPMPGRWFRVGIQLNLDI